jgi:Xaa-Pro aminopeptidase
VPHLEQENAQENWIADLRTYPEFPGVKHPVLWMFDEIRDRRIAVDALEARLFAAAAPGLEALQLSDGIDRLRAVKAPEELALVRAAAAYADFCLEHMRATLAAIVADGGTENDILAAGIGAARARMESEVGDRFDMTELGVVGSVHSGPRAALPHGHTTNRRPLPGEPIIAGIGATVGGYHAESGATFVLGDPSADTYNCLEVAAACDAAAVAALRPGATCSSVNEAALDAVRQAGLGAFLRHRIGHGMGIQGHEAPWLAPGDETILAAGMVFSNEPGIYRPGIDGYRTINTMIVTEDAAEIPSRFLATHEIDGRILKLQPAG